MKIKMFSKIGGFQNVTGDMKHMGDATGGLKHGDELYTWNSLTKISFSGL